MSVKENLTAARALIDTPEKWFKGAWEAKDGKCLCTLGALVVATNGNRDWFHAWTKEVLDAERPMRQLLPAGYASVAEYNDDPITTHSDILALIDLAIEAASITLPSQH